MRSHTLVRTLSAAVSIALLAGCSAGSAVAPRPASPIGGAAGPNSVAQLDPFHSGPVGLSRTFNMLVSFNGADGDGPYAALVQATDGDFYGTTSEGGTGYVAGTVFRMTSSGTLKTIYNFQGSDGYNPTSALIQATNGEFYGTTEGGGTSTACQFGCGTVFKITRGGTLKTLHSFNLTDGANPYGGLLQAKDGNFYGTTSYGGANNIHGTVFKITPAGALTTLHDFNGADGSESTAGLIQASDGNLYGTTEVGAQGKGTIFKISPKGKFAPFHIFDGSPGGFPTAGLIQATNGDLYGTTEYGDYPGGQYYGTVFKITLGGKLTNLHTFHGTDGANPFAGLIQAPNGNLYGTTLNGGANGDGAVYMITPSGSLHTIYSFQDSQAYPFAGVIRATDGKLYGTTYEGGVGNCGGFFCGMVYSLSKP
jgi:uncharacterized repeat protein (TIGR03803 family)